jgi:hypothetical protein
MNDNPPVSLAERFARRSAPAIEPTPPALSPEQPGEDGAEGYQAYKTGGDHRFEVMVTFRFHNGNLRALGYSYLVGLDFDPSKNLVLEFTNRTVTITGRNLTPLFKALAAHKVMWICEADPLSEPTEDAATVVNGIDFGEG